jgi:hypothetical protein
MDKQLSTGTVAGIIAVVVIVLGLVAWRYLSGGGQPAAPPESGRMQSGPPGAPMGPH